MPDDQWEADLKQAKHDRVLHLVFPMVEVWRAGNHIQFFIATIAALVGYANASYIGGAIGLAIGLLIGELVRRRFMKLAGKISFWWTNRPLTAAQESKLVHRYRRNKKWDVLFFKHNVFVISVFSWFA